MDLSIDFELTPTDWLKFASHRRARWSTIVRPIVATGTLILGVQHLFTSGLDWEFGLYLLFALFVGIPFVTTRLIVCCMLAIYRPTIHVSIDDETISVQSKHGKKIYPWSSFVLFGSATEYNDHFWLECGRGSVWIPKRAFPADTALLSFRRFVSEKMGDRCKFDAAQ